MSYLVHERGQYEPPACPGCGRRQHVNWIECTTFEDQSRLERRYVPGRSYCRTDGCSYNDLEQAR